MQTNSDIFVVVGDGTDTLKGLKALTQGYFRTFYLKEFLNAACPIRGNHIF